MREADAGHPEAALEAAGLLATSNGLSDLFPDDIQMLDHAMIVYDALYSWCRRGQDASRAWRPDALR